MALRILNPGIQPLGQFDGYDADYLTLLGGEVVTFRTALLGGPDKAAADALDGYVRNGSSLYRAAVTKTLVSGTRPLMLADEGTVGYGTLFGQVVGGVGGQVTGGSQLGPHTATASGKVTCWDKPGLYAVTLDACDTDATNGLQPTNTALTVGTALYATSAGVLTPQAGSAFEGGKVVGRFVEFMTNGSLVTTPNQLVAAMNSPSGPVPSAIGPSFYMAVFHFDPHA